MRRLEAVISTTLVDSQGERMSIEALHQLATSVSDSFIPIGVEHDPRVAPLGRLESAFVRERPDGEHEVVAVMDFFEDSDEPIDEGEKREITLVRHLDAGITISSDWTHRGDEDKEDIDEIAKVLKTNPVYAIKKAADPISIITLAGAFVLGGIASGFFGQVGSDGWNLIKEKLSRIFSRKEIRSGEQLFTFRAMIEREGYSVEIELIVSNPSIEEIDSMLNVGLKKLDIALPTYLANTPDIRRLVFEMKGDDLHLLFGVKKDCRPVSATVTVAQIIDNEGAP